MNDELDDGGARLHFTLKPDPVELRRILRGAVRAGLRECICDTCGCPLWTRSELDRCPHCRGAVPRAEPLEETRDWWLAHWRRALCILLLRRR